MEWRKPSCPSKVVLKKKSLMEECEEAGNYEKPDMFRVESRGKRLAKRKKKRRVLVVF